MRRSPVRSWRGWAEYDFGSQFEAELHAGGIELLRPARNGENPPPRAQFFKPLRQVIESINRTFKAHLDLERHAGSSSRFG